MDPHAATLVVIPTYNEAQNIETAIRRVQDAAPGVDVLVVDDGSPDGTAALVARHPDYLRTVFVLRRTRKDGLGPAYRAGFGWAIGHDYDVVVQMDADLSHPAERIPALLAELEHADLVVGSRYVAGGATRNWSWSRRLVSATGNAYVRTVLGLPVRDATSGFKAFRRSTLEKIRVTSSASNGYCFQIETAWRAGRLGLAVVEVPITFTDRTAGSSKMSGSIVVEAVLRVLEWRWRELRHPGTDPVTGSRSTRRARRGSRAAA